MLTPDFRNFRTVDNSSRTKYSFYQKKRRPWDVANGASAVEFAIGSLVFMLLLFGFIDLCRVLVIRSMMFAGTQNGLRLTRVSPDIEIDTTVLSPGYGNHGVPNADRVTLDKLLTARADIVTETLRLPRQLLGSSTGTGGAKLASISQTYNTLTQNETVVSDVAVLRPLCLN